MTNKPLNDQQTTQKSFWTLSPEKALLKLGSNLQGLADKTAQERLKQYGPNSLKGSSKSSSLMLFLLQFKSPVTLLLIFAAALSSIENFGSMNILCSDKTGTITEGKVTLHKALSVSGEPSSKTLHYASLQKGFQTPLMRPLSAVSPTTSSSLSCRVKCPTISYANA